jgi:dTDP-4-amino-4,6-dideoxygalactose transaminase
MTSETLAQCLREDVQAVILTHQFGLPAVVEPIVELCRQLGLFVIEDAAAALGATYRGRPVGTFGDASVISFHLTKVVNAGHAGVLLTNNDMVAERVQSLWSSGKSMAKGAVDFCRAAAWWVAMHPHCYPVLRRLRRILREDPLYEVVVPNCKPPTNSFGSCSRLVAQLASTQVACLVSIVSARRRVARIYAERLSGNDNGVRVCPVPDGAEPAWTQFPVFVENKEECYRFFLEHGIDLSWTFRYSCAASYGMCRAPNSERAARTLLGLPTYPGLAPEKAHHICDLFRVFLQN